MFLVGPPGSGKTTILDRFCNVLGVGNLAVDVPIRAMTSRFGLAHIAGSTLFFSDEQALDKIKSVGKFNNLVDGGWQLVEAKNKDMMEIMSVGKILMVMNQMPEIDSPDGYNMGIWRRLNFISFRVGYDERESSLSTRAISERAGVLNWQLEGLKRLLERDEWKPSKQSERLVAKYKGEHASVKVWFDKFAVPGKDNKIGSQVAFNNYLEWASSKVLGSVTRKEFTSSLRRMGYENRRSISGGRSQWHGFTLLQRSGK
jgi:putative DNA primase/helicase